MFRKNWFHVYMDEATDGTDGGAGGDIGIDIDATVDSLAAEIGLVKSPEGPAISSPSETDKNPPAVKDPAVTDKPADTTVVAKSPPAAWKKELHEHFGKLDPAVQDYIIQRETEVAEGFKGLTPEKEFAKEMRDVLAPHKDMITRAGLSESQAVKQLVLTHAQLSNPQTRQATAANVLKHYGVDIKALAEGIGEQPYVDPAVTELRQQVSQLTARQQAEQETQQKAKMEQIAKEVKTFAEDPANSYFDEVANDIVKLTTAGYTLKDAYDTAILANPVTRAKEQARLQKEAEETIRKNAEEAAKKAKGSRGTVVKGSGVGRATSEPKGSMDDTMRETLADIKSRTT